MTHQTRKKNYSPADLAENCNYLLKARTNAMRMWDKNKNKNITDTYKCSPLSRFIIRPAVPQAMSPDQLR
jgi:hypothetical protein